MPHRTRALSFEALESRRFLAANNILIEDGLLGFRGFKGDDVMMVEHIGNQYKLTLNGQSAFVNDYGLQGIIVGGFGGNDNITVDQSVTVFAGVLGGKGNDTIHGGGRGQNYLFGESGNDTIFSGPYPGATIISGGAGNDVIHCGVGNVEARGDKGNDTLYGDDSASALYGDAGNDFLVASSKGGSLNGGAGNDLLQGGAANDGLYGEGGNDTMYGVDGDDYLSGGVGNDIIYGGNGNDRLQGFEGRDQLFGELGDDEIFGGAANDLLRGGPGADWLYGDEGNDSINGDDGPDKIEGGLGNDVCHGGYGDDLIAGGVGRNQLDGDAGNNLLMINNATETHLNGLTSDMGNLGAWFGDGYYGHASYDVLNESGTLTYKLVFYFNAWRFDPGTYDLLVDGVNVGQLTVNEYTDPHATLVLCSTPTGSEQPFPSEFLGVHEGSMVQIVGLTWGIFQPLPFGATSY